MASAQPRAVPRFSARDAATIRLAWQHADFNAPTVARVLAPAADRPAEKLLPLWLWQTREPTARNAFIRLFTLAQSTPAAWTEAALDVAPWLRLGLLQRARGQYAPQLSLSFHDGTPLFADVPGESKRPQPDHVMGATRATLALERCLPPTKVDCALDVGTGAGLLSLRLAPRARRVLASDVNRRALALTRLNLTLAGAQNVETVASDRFRKLAGQTFNLIVGNLPFVVSPERRFVYRDGGLPADGFAAATVQEAGAHLDAGGHALLLVQWVHPRVSLDSTDAFEQGEEDHLARWVAGNGCHALFLRFTTESIADYALSWSEEPGIGPLRGRAVRFARWMKFYESRGIGAISTGLVVLRRAGRARPWMAVQPFAAPTDPCGAEIIELLDDIASHMRRR